MPDNVKPLPPGSRKAQNLGGYEELSEEELQAAFEGEKDPVAEAKAEEEAKLAAENDDPADEDDDEQEDADAQDEDDGDDEEEKADEAEEKEEDEESPLESRIRLLERRLELEALERTKETAARERAELLASKQAGRAGYLQQQLKKKQSPPKAQSKKKTEDDGDEDPWAEENAAQDNRQEQFEPVQELTQEQKEDREELVKMAINDEGQEFAKLHAGNLEDMPEEFIKRLRDLMQEEAAPYAKDFQTGSIKMVRKLARTCMSSAYATCRIEFADQVAENVKAKATTRKAESVAKSKRRKAKAAISKGGAGATKKPKPAKDYEDMDDEELEAAFLSEFGEDYRMGSAKSKHGGL